MVSACLEMVVTVRCHKTCPAILGFDSVEHIFIPLKT